MCGIVGYLGDRDSLPIILNGLKRLEYRGYDSSGIALYNGSGIVSCKSKGKISKLEKLLKKNQDFGKLVKKNDLVKIAKNYTLTAKDPKQ